MYGRENAKTFLKFGVTSFTDVCLTFNVVHFDLTYK